MQHLARSAECGRWIGSCADPSVKNYVWSWEPLPLVRTARACTAQKVKVELQSCRGSFFFWKRKEFDRAWEPVRQTPSLCRFAAHVRADSDGRSGCFRPEFPSWAIEGVGKEYLKNLREYLLLEKEHSLTLIAQFVWAFATTDDLDISSRCSPGN